MDKFATNFEQVSPGPPPTSQTTTMGLIHGSSDGTPTNATLPPGSTVAYTATVPRQLVANAVPGTAKNATVASLPNPYAIDPNGVPFEESLNWQLRQSAAAAGLVTTGDPAIPPQGNSYPGGQTPSSPDYSGLLWVTAAIVAVLLLSKGL